MWNSLTPVNGKNAGILFNARSSGALFSHPLRGIRSRNEMDENDPYFVTAPKSLVGENIHIDMEFMHFTIES